MPDALGYADAVRLLGGKDSRAVAAIANLAGGALSGLAVPIPMVLSWFDAKAELARLGNQLIREFSERRGGLKRYDRTQRLEAAHAVIVVSAYFEALAATDLPFALSSLELSAQEQARMVGGASAGSDDPYLVVTLFSVGRLLPGPQYPYENVGEALRDHYVEVSRALLRFVAGLAVWERLRPADRKRFASALHDVPAGAGRRYVELYRQLAVDFAEFAFWSVSREHSATRAGVRAVETALVELGTVLAEISTGAVPDERRAALARAHEAALGRPIVDSGDVAAGLQVPTLAASYLAPLFRAANVGPGARAADESWWAGRPVREDLAEFLTGYVTSPRAVRAPLLIFTDQGLGLKWRSRW